MAKVSLRTASISCLAIWVAICRGFGEPRRGWWAKSQAQGRLLTLAGLAAETTSRELRRLASSPI
jgi:hypothetical protein